MTLEQLRIFIEVAEREHVTKAANALNLTQSATSAAIAALEARYDVKLFDRIGRGIVLTKTGRDFLGEAREVVGRANAAAQMLGDLAGLKRGSLRIAASQTVANYWLPRRIQAFLLVHPDIDVHVMIANTETVAQAVHEHGADIGFVEGGINNAHLRATRIEGDNLIIVVGKSHPWARQPRVAPKSLTATGWVLREPGSGTRAMFEAALKRYALHLSDLSVRLVLPSNEAVRSAVEAGDCATAISDLVAGPSLKARTLVRIQLELPRRPFWILRHKERHVSHVEQAFLDTLKPTA